MGKETVLDCSYRVWHSSSAKHVMGIVLPCWYPRPGNVVYNTGDYEKVRSIQFCLQFLGLSCYVIGTPVAFCETAPKVPLIPPDSLKCPLLALNILPSPHPSCCFCRLLLCVFMNSHVLTRILPSARGDGWKSSWPTPTPPCSPRSP